jgi:hypothetical protein
MAHLMLTDISLKCMYFYAFRTKNARVINTFSIVKMLELAMYYASADLVFL